MPNYLAALRDGRRLVWLSECGRWFPKSVFKVRGSPFKLRRFHNQESAKGIAEEWAKMAGCHPHVEEV